MPKRFVPALHESRRVLNDLHHHLKHSVDNADKLWTEALSAVFGSDLRSLSASDLRSLSASDVQSILLGVVTSSQDIPWKFYNTVSALIRQAPPFIGETLIKDISIKTGYECEQLRLSAEGHWQIAWIIHPDAIDPEYREIVLDWYIPPENNNAPLVPPAIMDHIASCSLLLRNKLVLPAASTLSVVLEAALWHELATNNLLQNRQEITYTSVEWHFEKWHNQLRVTIEGSDKSIKDIPQTLLTGTSLREITFPLRRTHIKNADKTVDLQLRVDENFISFLASNQVAEIKDLEPGRGLSTAIERARKEKLGCLNTIAPMYDRTLISLRNSLIHLPANGILKDPIPIPGDGEIRTTDELNEREEFVHHLLYLVSQVIRHIYKNRQ